MLTLNQASKLLANNEITAQSLVEQALLRIEDPKGEGKFTFTHIYHDNALIQANEAVNRQKNNQRKSSIDGIPISIKDLFDVAGEATTAGSIVLTNATAAENNATVVDKLLNAGAVIVGKTNMTEFAYSGLGINPHYGTPANPYERSKRLIPGGSSSGAAISVSDGMCLGAIGSDTGGSIRIPAALCGLTGFKPSANTINQTGVLPLSTSLDSVGVMAHDVASCLLIYNEIAEQKINPVTKTLSEARFAIPQTLVLDSLDKQVSDAFYWAIEALKSAGAKIDEIEFTEFSELNEINKAGGLTAYEAWQWHHLIINKHKQSYDPRVLSRINKGEFITPHDIELLKQKRTNWQQRVVQRMHPYTALLMPTVPLIAPSIETLTNDEDTYFNVNGLMLRNTGIINFLDGCAISLPCHKYNEAPVGLMIAGSNANDQSIIEYALTIESHLSQVR